MAICRDLSGFIYLVFVVFSMLDVCLFWCGLEEVVSLVGVSAFRCCLDDDISRQKNNYKLRKLMSVTTCP